MGMSSNILFPFFEETNKKALVVTQAMPKSKININLFFLFSSMYVDTIKISKSRTDVYLCEDLLSPT